MTRFVDLSHPVVAGESANSWLPGPMVAEFLTREASRDHYPPGTSFVIHQITLIGNSGTYLDSPFHRHEDGPDLAELSLERLAQLPGIVVDASSGSTRALEANVLPEDGQLKGAAILFRTAWDRCWGTPAYAVEYPFLSASLAAKLAEVGVALVGIDALNVDDLDDGSRPAHTILLGAGIPIVENLRWLDRLPQRGFRFSAVPAPVQGCSAFPVRAFAIV